MRALGPPVTRFAGCSYQLKILPEFMMFFGSSARFIVRIISTLPAAASVMRKAFEELGLPNSSGPWHLLFEIVFGLQKQNYKKLQINNSVEILLITCGNVCINAVLSKTPFNMYTTQEVRSVTGIGPQMLHYLCRTGLVTPSASRKRGLRGHGIARQYSFGDLVICRVVQGLTASGVSPLKVKSAIRELHAMGISLQRLPAARVVILGKSVYVWDESTDPFRVVDGQQAFGFILDLQTISDELITELDKIAA